MLRSQEIQTERSELSFIIEILEEELERRCRRNPSYSLRSFSRAINLSPSSLSLVLSGKRNLSRKKAIEIAEALGLSVGKRKKIVAAATDRRKLPETSTNNQKFGEVSHNEFQLITQWYHYAILSLLELDNAQLDPKWIAKRIKISETCATLAIKRLKKMGLIEELDGKWKQSGLPLTIDRSITSQATKKFQKQLLKKAIFSLENDEYQKRDHTSMTMAISEDLIPYAQKRIKEFRRSLTKDLEEKARPDRVYNLTIQLYPISEK